MAKRKKTRKRARVPLWRNKALKAWLGMSVIGFFSFSDVFGAMVPGAMMRSGAEYLQSGPRGGSGFGADSSIGGWVLGGIGTLVASHSDILAPLWSALESAGLSGGAGGLSVPGFFAGAGGAGSLRMHNSAEDGMPSNLATSIEGCLIRSVYDGDTIRITCNDKETSARLVGFDTPELSKPGCEAEAIAARAARDTLIALIQDAQSVSISHQGLDRYQRDLVRLHVDGRDVADLMVGAGLARKYDGRARQTWCGRV